jgi:hypothetical protein
MNFVYNVIWLDNHVEPSVQSFTTFQSALNSVTLDINSYVSRYRFEPDVVNNNEVDEHFFARMEDVFEVEIVKTRLCG